MSGIIDTVGSKSGIVGSDVYPAGHVIQTKHVKINCTDNDSNYCSTSATGGRVINTASTDLQVTGFSMTAGNLLKVSYSSGMVLESAGNFIWGVKVDSTIYAVNFINSNHSAPMVCNFSLLPGGLSSVTIAAWMASPNGNSKQLYHHDYTSYYTTEWCMTVQEIQM